MPELNDSDLKSNAFVRAMLDHFKDTMLKYHAGATTTEERQNRALAIATKIAAIELKDGTQVFSLAPIVTKEIKDGVEVLGYTCTDPNDKCCCGTICIPASSTCPDCPPPPPTQ